MHTHLRRSQDTSSSASLVLEVQALAAPAGPKAVLQFVLQTKRLAVRSLFMIFFLLHLLQQMDNSVYTFEQLLQQSLNSGGSDDLCKVIQRCQDRVLKVTFTAQTQ